MRKEDSSFVPFKIKPDEPNAYDKVDETGLLSYTVMGSQDFFDDEGFPRVEDHESFKVHAQADVRINGVLYYVKLNNRGGLYDPFDPYERHSVRSEVRGSVPRWTMRKTDQEVFTWYAQYLKTQNRSYLLNAERKMNNG